MTLDELIEKLTEVREERLRHGGQGGRYEIAEVQIGEPGNSRTLTTLVFVRESNRVFLD